MSRNVYEKVLGLLSRYDHLPLALRQEIARLAENYSECRDYDQQGVADIKRSVRDFEKSVATCIRAWERIPQSTKSNLKALAQSATGADIQSQSAFDQDVVRTLLTMQHAAITWGQSQPKTSPGKPRETVFISLLSELAKNYDLTLPAVANDYGYCSWDVVVIAYALDKEPAAARKAIQRIKQKQPRDKS